MTKPDLLQMRPFPEADQRALDTAYRIHPLHEAPEPAAYLAEHGPAIRAIATRGTVGADAATIHACPNLELVAVYGVGFDAVDLDACRAQGVRVTNTPDVLTEDVADLAIAMMLAQRRGLVGAETWVRSGAWAAQGLYPLQRRVHGARAGILGLGRIGTAIAHRLTGFGMDIAYCDPFATPAQPWTALPSAEALAQFADILFVTLAATADTRHIVNAPVLAALGADGLLINVSRAANLDETALLDALESGTLGAAALDVFAGEPRIDPRFLALDNVLLQPHHASGTVETRAAMGQLMRDNLAAHFAGRALLTPVL